VTVIAPEVSVSRPVLPRQFVRFAAVGLLNTAVFLVVYLLFRTVVSATAANLLATFLTTLTGTSANGKVTFGVHGPIGLRQHARSMAVTILGLVITTVAVNLAGTAVSELVVLVMSGAVAGGIRFVLMRHWVFEGTP
jgi:putative flippase GtrA